MNTVEALIAEARALSEYVSEHIPGSRYKPVIDRLTNALESMLSPTPTGDERERLIALIDAVDAEHDFDSGDLPGNDEYADAILAAGFRVAPELNHDHDWADGFCQFPTCDALVPTPEPVYEYGVTAVEELENLPVGSVVLDSEDSLSRLVVKESRPWAPDDIYNLWDGGGGVLYRDEMAVVLPARILFVPVVSTSKEQEK